MNNTALRQSKKYLVNLKTNVRSIQWADWAMIFFFASRLVTFIFSSVIGSKGVFFAMAVQAGLFIMALVEAKRKKDWGGFQVFILLYLTVTALILLTMLLNPLILEWMMDFSYGLILKIFDVRKSLFAALALLLVRDPKRIFKNLKAAAWLMFIYLGAQAVLYFVTGSWTNYYIVEDIRSESLTYNLSFGYEMIFVGLVFLASFLGEHRPRDLVMGVVATLLAFVLGSRGIIFPLAIFLIIAFFRYSSKRMRMRIGLGALIAAAFLALSINILANRAGDENTITGIRNIDMILTGSFADDNGRAKIWDLAIQGVHDSFPLGFGVYGDRPYVGQKFRWGYSHNIILEMLISFGVFGLVFVLGIIGLVIWVLLKKRARAYHLSLLVLIGLNAKLLISDSFWNYTFFWALLALLMLAFMDRKIWDQKNLEEKAWALKGRDTNDLDKTSIVETVKEVAVVETNSQGEKQDHARSSESDAIFKSRWWQVKSKAKQIGALIFLNGLLLTLFLNQQVQAQWFHPVSFERPTVVIGIQDSIDYVNGLLMDQVDNGELRASFFIDSLAIEKRELDRIIQSDDVDLNLALNRRELNKADQKILEDYLNSGLEQLSDKTGNTSFAASTLLADVYPFHLNKIQKQTDAFLINDLRKDNYYYKQVSQDDLYQLNAMRSSLSPRIYRGRMPYLMKQIDLAARHNGLIVLYFSHLRAGADKETEYSYEYFNEVVDYLKFRKFDMITVSELADLGRLEPEEKTLKNYLLNLEIVRKLGFGHE